MNTENKKDGTVEDVIQLLSLLYTPGNKNGWNDYPLYLICEDGVTRKIKTIGAGIIPHGWRDKAEQQLKHKPEEIFAFDGGIYLVEKANDKLPL